LKRIDGSLAKIKSVGVANPSIFTREDGNQYVEVTATFVDTDTSTLVTLAQQSIEKNFSKDKVASYGLDKNALSFNFGQEDENQDSFKTLALAFPILLVVIYIFLAFQFKSMLQPLLIFLALPFSLFGITLGLYITENPFSFFAMLGFFALIGLSIKNSILLTDYANQSRKAGMDPVDAAHEALAERFRPLIATSFTAVFSLIPLAITSPFWEGLAVVLIGGLLSSTFLVITVFPYYYLGSEFLRAKISRKIGLSWLILTITLILGLSKITAMLAIASPIVAVIIIVGIKKIKSSK
ncbi:MAG: efflux RND transporter permease subunit, partial [Patescibacteria group bacterium]